LRDKERAHRFLQQIETCGFAVTYWDGDRISYGSGPPSFHITVNDRAALAKCIDSPLLSLPEAYISGRIDIEGSLQQLLRLCYRIDKRLLRISSWQLARSIIANLRHRNTLRRARRNIALHYDLGNDFFAKWLDNRMIYSCAYFERPDDSIDVAQAQKLEHLCRKLQLRSGDRLLDIGCGWGGLATYAAKVHGVKVVGITLSEEQRSFADALVRREKLEHAVEIRLQDYRDIAKEEVFDRVVSVGMLEHVGETYIQGYMDIIARLLRPLGVGVLQTMGQTSHQQVTPWITRHIFPGMYLPTLGELSRAMVQTNLRAVDIENLRPHYGMTLDSWIATFEDNVQDISAAHGETLVRLFRMYLNSAATAFKYGDLNLWQITFTHGWSDEVPLTRRNLYVDRVQMSAKS
jgi:cyclopropane-fatty-acyl-phospholipid synthase